eukprot:TRINITY_DN10064_c0_g1_i3.p1 TRINITY_DN10064_c0_g1~~TRINITY_DN10064_c0_g1_i3.p1  ORF type:complete len:369 (+),score=46.86 TRINITY_DN10064_c0_g1_i3:64-1170(+)
MMKVQQLRQDLYKTQDEIEALQQELGTPYNPRENETELQRAKEAVLGGTGYSSGSLQVIADTAAAEQASAARRIVEDELVNSRRRLGLVNPSVAAPDWQHSRCDRSRQVAQLLSRSGERIASDSCDSRLYSTSPVPAPAPAPYPSDAPLAALQTGDEIEAVRGGEWCVGIASHITPTTVDVHWKDGYITPGVPLEYTRSPQAPMNFDTDKMRSPTRSSNYPIMFQGREVTPVGGDWGTKGHVAYKRYSPERMDGSNGIAATAANWSTFLRSSSKSGKKRAVSKPKHSVNSTATVAAVTPKRSSRVRSLSQKSTHRDAEYKQLFEPLKKMSTLQFDRTTSVAPKIGSERRFSTPRGWAPGQYHLLTSRR